MPDVLLRPIQGLRRVLPAPGGKIRILTHRRSLQYLGLLLAMLILSMLLPHLPLGGGMALGAAAETLAVNLALLTGLAGLLRYAGAGGALHAFVGSAYLGAALLDGYHALTAWGLLAGGAGSVPAVTASTSRWFLPLWLWIGVWAAGSDQPAARSLRQTRMAIWLGAAGTALLGLLSVRLWPAASEAASVAGSVGSAALFFAAIEVMLRRRHWPSDTFEHCLLLSLVLGFCLNTLFVASARTVDDPFFAASLYLKNLSYLVVLAGLAMGMRRVLRQAEGQAVALADSKELLRHEIVQRGRIQKRFEELNHALEQRVEERTRDLAADESAALDAQKRAEDARRLEHETNRQLRAQIDERIAMEKALRESERRLHMAIAAGKIGLWTWDIETGQRTWDERVCEIMGERPQGLAPGLQPGLFRVLSDDLPVVEQALRRTLEQGEDFHIETRIAAPDGGVRYVVSRGAALHDEHGKTIGLVGTLADVTEDRRREEALRRQGEELNQMVQVLRCLNDVARLLEQAELPLEQIYRRTLQVLPLSWHDPPNTFARLVAFGREYRGDGWRETAVSHGADIVAGEQKVGRIEIGFAAAGPEHERFRREETHVIEMVAVSLGRTIEYRRAAESLRRSEQRFRGLFDHMISACALHEIIVDENGKPFDYRFLQINPSFEQLTGLQAGETVGKTAREVLPRFEEEWLETCGQVALSGERVRTEQFNQDLGRHFEVAVFSPEKGRFAVILNDITERKQAEAERAADHNLLRTVIDNLPDSVYVKDTAGRYLAANAANLARIGLHEEAEVKGKTVFDFFPAEFARFYDADDRAVMDSLVTINEREEPYRNAHGEVRLYSTTKAPLFDSDGRVIGLVGISRDITERKQAELKLRESRRQMETLLGNLPGMAYRCENDLNWTMSFVSKGCHALTGLQPDELLELSYADLIHPKDREAVWDQVQQAIARREPFQLEYRIQTVDGRTKWVWEQGTAVFTENGEVEALEGFISDISDRWRAKQKLERKAKELAASNAELEQFAYAASHDLQEPLRMIAGYTQLLARRYRGRLDKDADEFIRFAVEGTERMQTLIHDLLAYSRAGRSPAAPEPVELEDCVRASLANLRAMVEESAANVEVEPLPRVTGHRSQLVQLFQNLVGNAVKYRGNEPPRVRICSQRRGDEWVIAVQDNGIGIDPKFREQVFELFRRLHGRGEYHGTGIGLALCRKIVESHGGRIWVESELGRGATFQFTLPAEPGVAKD